MRVVGNHQIGLLLVVVSCHLASNCLGVLASHERHPLTTWFYMVFHGVTTSQPVLLATWAVFGSEPRTLRTVGPGLILVAVTAAPFLMLGAVWNSEDLGLLRPFLGYQVALFGACGALFLPLRALASCCIVRTTPASINASRPGTKLSVGDLLAMIAFCAVGLAGLRVYESQMGAVAWPLAGDALHAVVALAFLPIFLADKPPAQKFRVAAFVLAADLAISLVLVLVPFHGMPRPSFLIAWLPFSAGFFGSIAVALSLARAAGYRLVRSAKSEL